MATEDVPITLTCIGTVQAYNAVNVKTRVDGEIMRVLFREGQDVKQGDPLVIIDPRPFQAQLEQQLAARAKDQALLDSASLDMRRYDRLVAQDSLARQQADTQHALVAQYHAQLQNDDAQIDYARTQLAYTTLRAPIGGRLGVRQVDQTTGTVKLKAKFPNQALKLWPGNFVNGRITVDIRRDGLTVPVAAVRHGPRGDYVWLVKEDNTVTTRGVTAAQVFDGRVLVDKNVAPGDLVVTDGMFRLDNGSPVAFERPKPEAGRQPAATAN